MKENNTFFHGVLLFREYCLAEWQQPYRVGELGEHLEEGIDPIELIGPIEQWLAPRKSHDTSTLNSHLIHPHRWSNWLSWHFSRPI